jgi:RNA polymerase-binding transcription factor DksA
MAEPTTTLSDALREQLRERLVADRDRVRDQLEQLGAGNDLHTYDEGFADSGQVTAERGEVEALVGSLLETLRDVDEALARFDAGTFGTCEECGGEITPDRLEAMPAARCCIACASKKR